MLRYGTIVLLVAWRRCEHLPPQNWYSPLLVACLAGERCNDAVEVLLAAGANPNGHNRVSCERKIMWCGNPVDHCRLSTDH